MKKIFIIILVSQLPLISLWASCSAPANFKSIDLRKDFPPTQDQDSLGVCYAYASADLYSYYINKNKLSIFDMREKPTSVSPLYVAMMFNDYGRDLEWRKKASTMSKGELKAAIAENEKKLKSIPDSDFNEKSHTKDRIDAYKIRLKNYDNKNEIELIEPEWGAPQFALEELFTKGYCLEKDLPSSDYYNSEIFKCIFPDGDSKYSNPMEVIRKINEALLENNNDKATCVNLLFPNQNLENIQAILKQTDTKIRSPLSEAVANLCEHYNIPKEQIPSIKTDMDNPMRLIDESFDKGSPVIINYHANIYTGKLNDPRFADGHVSILVGRRFNTERCEPEYILRNSWGPKSCEGKRNQYNSSKLTSSQKKDDKRSITNREQCRSNCAKEFHCNLKRKNPCDSTEQQSDAMSFLNCEKGCTDTYWIEHHHIHKTPYTCDGDEYVIPKSLLSSGVYNAISISK